MTEIEFSQVEDMLQANYQFLDFTNAALHELWYESLKRFDVIEVKDGVRQYMEYERNTPTLADLLQYIRPIREKRVEEYEHNVNLLLKDSVKCKACKDRGYILVRFLQDTRPSNRVTVMQVICALASGTGTMSGRTGRMMR